MKIAIINDTHWGARNDNIVFLEYFTKFYENIFFPELKERGITTILHLGDLLDRRKYINYVTAKMMEDVFFKQLKDNDIQLHLCVGNHDTYYKNSNEVNGPKQLYGQRDNVNIYWNEPVELDFDGCKIMLAPWICADNADTTATALATTNAQILMGHFEIQGFEMMRGQLCEHGMDKRVFDKFDIVYSGHFHHPSTHDNISYLGAPYEMTWTDYEGKRGFHIFDTETRKLEFIRNPYRLFYKLNYSDTDLTIEDIDNLDISSLTNTYVKVIVKNKTNPYLFDLFMDKLQLSGAADIKVLEDKMNLESIDDSEFIDEAQDTLTILKQYVDSLEVGGNKSKIDGFLRDLYREAINL